MPIQSQLVKMDTTPAMAPGARARSRLFILLKTRLSETLALCHAAKFVANFQSKQNRNPFRHELVNMIKKLLLLAAIVASFTFGAALKAEGLRIEIGDRPYYSHG